jgi:hypothetical protein
MDINQLNKAYFEQYAKDHNLIEQYKDCMKQQPVAWITKSCKCYSTPLVAEAYNNKEELIPVYTAPRELSDELFNAKIEILRLQDEVHWLTNHPLRELSDEEIHEIYIKHSTYDNEKALFVDVYGFARAILKKASEK